MLRVLIKVFGALMIIFSQGIWAAEPDWTLFKNEFLTSDGRVIDKANANISHTEGQGMAMLMAIHSNDQAAFDRIWNWSKTHLHIRDDKLFSWSWSEATGVKDINNASDGDLFIAWALVRAYKKWGNSDYLNSALEISQAIRSQLLRETARGTVILPGVDGFEKNDGYIVNLSYWVFPAFDELNSIDPSPQWLNLKNTGIQLIQEARFGKWGLPPDWLLLSNTLSPAINNRFGYDAVRIPLYLIWGKVATNELLAPFQNFWGNYQSPEFLPSWTDLKSNEIGNYNASIGFHNIAALTKIFPNVQALEIQTQGTQNSYYSYMLTFFTQLALEDLKK